MGRLRSASAPHKAIGLILKRIIDYSFSLVGLLILSPLFVIFAILIYRDSGTPIFFRQDRIGLHGSTFVVYKFRTMIIGAADGAVSSKIRDPRVTRTGLFLRKWSLDELPQLINVIRGEMSIIGPRPDRTFRLSDYTDTERRRLEMRPGITGLAQISGRNLIPWKQRYELDVRYVNNWSLLLDLKILFRTAIVTLSRKGIDYE